MFSAHLAGQTPLPQAERDVSWKRLFPNIGSDQKHIWLFPARIKHGHNLLATSAVIGVTAALIASDPSTAPHFRRTTSFDGFNRAFSGSNTSYAMIAAPVAMYATGLVRTDSKMQHTALLAGEAIASAEIVTTVMKDIDRRLRPVAIPPDGNFTDTWFKDDHRFLRASGSFPSGHTIVAFSVATVVARRYGKQHRWVPYLAYGLAATVGFSRITLSSHFPSDVFMGAALGYSISRFTVLRE
jgi:membrane-associated phospholipid phosphatase